MQFGDHFCLNNIFTAQNSHFLGFYGSFYGYFQLLLGVSYFMPLFTLDGCSDQQFMMFTQQISKLGTYIFLLLQFALITRL